MKVTIELSGTDIQSNIDAIQRAIDKKPLCCDSGSLIYTKSILEGIKKQLQKKTGRDDGNG